MTKKLHKKPTKDELEESIKKSAEELEKDLDKDDEEAEKIEKTAEELESPEPTPSEPEEEPESEPSEPEPEPTPSPYEVDYKKKFVESTREAQVLHSKNRKMNEAIDEAAKLTEPTDEELQKAYPDIDIDIMSAGEKQLYSDNLLNKKRFEMIDKVSQDAKKIGDWLEKVDKFVENPETIIKNPALEGRVEDFKLFASKPTRRGVDFEDLTSAFLYDASSKAKPKKKGQMFESGTSGHDKKPKKTQLTIEEGRKLRDTNYDKWKEMLKAGKIEAVS